MAFNLGRFLLILCLAAALPGCNAQKEEAGKEQPAWEISEHAQGQLSPARPDYYQSLPPYAGDRRIFEQGLTAMAKVNSYRLLAHTTVREKNQLKTYTDGEFDYVAPDKRRLWKAVENKVVAEEICLGSTLYIRKGNSPTWEKKEGSPIPAFPITVERMTKDLQGARDIRLLMDGEWEGVECIAVSFLLPPEVYPGVDTRVNYFFEKSTNRIIRIERINEKKGRADYTETFYRFEDFDIAPDILPPRI